ncbi:MAG: sulfotransferase family 2 domain-containing protein [Parachlamydiaceae bacterium]
MISIWYLLIFLSFFCAPFPNELDARLYFMHVPKTGGTTLRLLLELQLDANEIYPVRNAKQAKVPIKQDLISGHFPYWFCKQSDENFEEAFKVTILRDPIERYLSFLRAKKREDKTLPTLESVLKIRKAKCHKYHYGLMDNALCRHLSADPLLEGKQLLDSAKQSLQKIDCVLFFDNYSQDIIELFNRLGIELNEDSIPRMNVTEQEPISKQLFEEVRQLNGLDIQLYNYAKTHLQKKRTTYQLRTPSFENILKRTNSVDYTFELPLNGKGWSYREKVPDNSEKNPIYRWVMEKPALIHFALEEGFDYELCFTANAITADVFPRVNINGKEIEILKCDDQVFSMYYGKIPKEYITKNLTELAFYSSKALQDGNLDSSQQKINKSPLSFAINRIQISTF